MESMYTGRIRLKPVRGNFRTNVLALQLEQAYDNPRNEGGQVEVERAYRWIYATPEILLNSNNFELFKKLLEEN